MKKLPRKGRPSLNRKAGKSPNLTIRCPPEVRRRWEKAAARHKPPLTLAEFVRLAGDAYADQLLGPPSKP